MKKIVYVMLLIGILVISGCAKENWNYPYSALLDAGYGHGHSCHSSYPSYPSYYYTYPYYSSYGNCWDSLGLIY